MDIKYNEVFSSDKLAYIINNNKKYNKYIRYDNDIDDWNPFLLPEKYLMASNNNIVNVSYKYSKKNNEGRLYAAGGVSLQGFCREIRHTIANDFYNDVDIVNCHPVILYHICKNNKFNCPYLIEYIENRDNILNDIIKINEKLNKDDVKKIILSLLNGGKNEYNNIVIKNNFIKKFKSEINNILDSICNIDPDKYKNFKPKNAYNKKGSYVNTLLCIEENKILLKLLDFFNIKYNDIVVLCFDGLMIPKNINCDLNNAIKYIKDSLGYDINLKIKDMNEGFNIPDDIPKFNHDTFKWSVVDNDTINLLNGPLMEADIADYMYKLYGHDYIIYGDYTYCWNGTYWLKDVSVDCIFNLINTSLFNRLKNSADKEFNNNNTLDLYQKLLKKLLRLRNHNTKKGIVEEFKLLIKVDKDIFDLQPDLLGFTNGVYDLKNNIFRSANRDDYISLIVPYDYRKSTIDEMDTLLKFINSVLPVKEEKDFLLKALSSGLAGRTLENILILTGSGRNGKDTLISYLLQQTLGDKLFYNNSNIVITGNSSQGANQEKNNMDKKRVVMFNEPNKDSNLKCSTLKEITGGKEINARGLYSSNTRTVLHCTNIILCNKIPTLDNIDEAISQRLYVIPFRSLFRKPEDIAKLPEDTKYVYEVNTEYKEMSFINENKLAFMNLLLDYYVIFKNDGYVLKNAPQSIKDLSDAYMSDSDDFLSWFNDIADKTNDSNDVIKMIDLYEIFRQSDLYINMTKKEKRAMNKKKFCEEVSSNPNLKTHFRERYQKNNKNINQCIIGYKIKVFNGFDD